MFDYIRETYDEILLNWSIIQQAMAPLRLTRWQMFKLFAAEIHRDNPILVKIIVLSGTLFWLSVIVKAIRPKAPGAVLTSGLKSQLKGIKTNIGGNILKSGLKGPDAPHIVNAGNHQLVVYSPDVFDEIKRLDKKEASAQDYFRTISHGYFGNETPALLKTIAVDLSQSIPLKVPSQQKDARIAFDKYLGYCPDYRPIPLYDLMTKVSASMHASLFGGHGLSNGDWPTNVQQLISSFYFAVRTLDRLPNFLQPFARPLLFLPASRVKWNMSRSLEPIIRGDIEVYERKANREELLKPSAEGRLPFTHWLMSRYNPGAVTQARLVRDYLDLCAFSAIKCASLISSIVVELAARPQLQDELCREIESVLVNGQLPLTKLKELRKMDSVMRETSRLHPFSQYTLCRQTRQPLQLSSGPLLPPGTVIGVNAHQINNSAKQFPKPEVFDPERFLNKRSKPGAEQIHQFVSTGPSDPNWGDGIQACPGRFFANSSLKVCLAHLLTNYRIMSDQSKRVKQGDTGKMQPTGLFSPDMEVKVLFQSKH